MQLNTQDSFLCGLKTLNAIFKYILEWSMIIHSVLHFHSAPQELNITIEYIVILPKIERVIGSIPGYPDRYFTRSQSRDSIWN
jgi:hypothetical protein